MGLRSPPTPVPLLVGQRRQEAAIAPTVALAAAGRLPGGRGALAGAWQWPGRGSTSQSSRSDVHRQNVRDAVVDDNGDHEVRPDWRPLKQSATECGESPDLSSASDIRLQNARENPSLSSTSDIRLQNARENPSLSSTSDIHTLNGRN